MATSTKLHTESKTQINEPRCTMDMKLKKIWMMLWCHFKCILTPPTVWQHQQSCTLNPKQKKISRCTMNTKLIYKAPLRLSNTDCCRSLGKWFPIKWGIICHLVFYQYITCHASQIDVWWLMGGVGV